MSSNDKISARIQELQRAISDGALKLAIRNRSSRLPILQNNLDRMSRVIAARAFEYADHPGGASGMLIRDYRGKNAEKVIWRFDAALLS